MNNSENPLHETDVPDGIGDRLDNFGEFAERAKMLLDNVQWINECLHAVICINGKRKFTEDAADLAHPDVSDSQFVRRVKNAALANGCARGLFAYADIIAALRREVDRRGGVIAKLAERLKLQTGTDEASKAEARVVRAKLNQARETSGILEKRIVRVARMFAKAREAEQRAIANASEIVYENAGVNDAVKAAFAESRYVDAITKAIEGETEFMKPSKRRH